MSSMMMAFAMLLIVFVMYGVYSTTKEAKTGISHIPS